MHPSEHVQVSERLRAIFSSFWIVMEYFCTIFCVFSVLSLPRRCFRRRSIDQKQIQKSFSKHFDKKIENKWYFSFARRGWSNDWSIAQLIGWSFNEWNAQSNRCLLKMAPNFSPKTVQIGAKTVQNNPKTIQNGSKTVQNGSKRSKTVQTGSNEKTADFF